MSLEREEKPRERINDRGEPSISQGRKKKKKGKKRKNQIKDSMALHLFQFSHGSQGPTNSPRKRERERENSVDRIEAPRCIDNENTGNDLTVREKRPTVGHKPSIPRAKFIRRPL